jgi:hypothetical protein
MTLKQYLFWMALSTGLSWLGFVAVLMVVDPTSGGPLGFALFYATLALASIGTIAVIGLLARALARPHEAAAKHAAVSFRQGALLSGLLIGSLALHAGSLLTWWNLLLFTATVTTLEFFMISVRRGPR